MNTKLKEEFNEFIGKLLIIALDEYHETEQYKLTKEKTDRMRLDCQMQFTENERTYALECFDFLSDTYAKETEYAFKKAFTYGIILIK